VIVHFVYIGGIVVHHCLNCPFIILTYQSVRILPILKVSKIEPMLRAVVRCLKLLIHMYACLVSQL
jgi:hypothetical protein